MDFKFTLNDVELKCSYTGDSITLDSTIVPIYDSTNFNDFIISFVPDTEKSYILIKEVEMLFDFFNNLLNSPVMVPQDLSDNTDFVEIIQIDPLILSQNGNIISNFINANSLGLSATYNILQTLNYPNMNYIDMTSITLEFQYMDINITNDVIPTITFNNREYFFNYSSQIDVRKLPSLDWSVLKTWMRNNIYDKLGVLLSNPKIPIICPGFKQLSLSNERSILIITQNDVIIHQQIITNDIFKNNKYYILTELNIPDTTDMPINITAYLRKDPKIAPFYKQKEVSIGTTIMDIRYNLDEFITDLTNNPIVLLEIFFISDYQQSRNYI